MMMSRRKSFFDICVQRMERREDFPCSWVPGDDKVAIEGSGELNGDLLSGTYTLFR